MTIVAPDMAVRAEIGGIGCAGALRLRLWRGGDRTDCGRSGHHKRASDKGCPDQALHDGLLSLIQTIKYAQQSRQFQGIPSKSKQARNEAGLCDICAELSRLPAMPVTMVMAMMPAVPPMMVMMPPMHFRGRRPGVILNRRGGAGIAERQRIGAFRWSGERRQRTNGGESQNFRELHECSPWVGGHVCAESLAATLHAI